MSLPPSEAGEWHEALGALDQAVRRSGVYRTAGVVAVLLLGLAVMVARLGAFDEEQRVAFTLGPMALTGALLVYESILLAIEIRSMRRARPLPAVIQVITAIVECSMPTAVMSLLWSFGMFEPHQAILVPALIAYTFFIVLSVLQLQPWITALMTILASGQYMGLVAIADRQGAFEAPGSLPDVSMYTMPVTLAMSGICAVFVAVRVRRYVETAVREEARRASAEREIRAASHVQASVLPETPPRISGFAVSGWNRQAELAGGDYYDWIELPSGQVVVSLADVAGHGLGPALVTAACRAYARSQFRRSAELAPAIGELNALLAADLSPGRFVTFVAVVLTPDTDDVSVLSAGHGPMLCYRAATGGVESWGADELPIGVEESLDAGRGTTVTLGQGDAIVLITDGFFEWRNPGGEQWGTGRLHEALARHGTLAPDALIAALVSEVEAFAGTPQDDDLSAVVIRRTAPTGA